MTIQYSNDTLLADLTYSMESADIESSEHGFFIWLENGLFYSSLQEREKRGQMDCLTLKYRAEDDHYIVGDAVGHRHGKRFDTRKEAQDYILGIMKDFNE